jgi:hypothetical protein
MADFKTKLITLAGITTMFAGMAFGQASTVGTSGAAATFVRAEDTTALLAPMTININLSSTATTTVNVQDFLTPALTVTSQSSTATPPVSETTITQTNNANANCPALGPAVAGVVSSSTVNFTGVALGQATGGGCVVTLTITNIRVNATTVPVGGGIPGSISAQAFVSGTNIALSQTATNVLGYVTPGLTAIKISGTPASNPICTAVAPETAGAPATLNPSFSVTLSEGFAGAFKTAAGEQSTGLPVTSGTRISVTLNNVPTNVIVYLPITVTATGSASTLTLLKANTADGAAPGYAITAASTVNPGSSNTLIAGAPAVGQPTIANNTTTAYYEVSAASATIDTFVIPVLLSSSPGTVPTASSAITATVSFASVSASSYPNLTASSAATVTGSNYIACNTTLLFPYVTNASQAPATGGVTGFETGIAISNTSLDNLKTGGGSSAASQNGTCTLSFFSNAVSANNPATVVMTNAALPGGVTNVPAGTTIVNSLTGVAGANFTGYMIANCNFQYAHGFAYISNNFGLNTGMAMGYTAKVLPGTRVASTATPESLGE